MKLTDRLLVAAVAHRRARGTRPPWPSAASTWPRPTPSSSTRPRRWCWSATTTRPSSPWPTTSRASRKEFAIVVPVPTVLEQGQIHVGDRALIEHLDAYSGAAARRVLRPRPVRAAAGCSMSKMSRRSAGAIALSGRSRPSGPRSLGVTIEAQYTVGEYDILILSAQRERRPRDLAARQRLPRARRARPPCSAATSSRA